MLWPGTHSPDRKAKFLGYLDCGFQLPGHTKVSNTWYVGSHHRLLSIQSNRSLMNLTICRATNTSDRQRLRVHPYKERCIQPYPQAQAGRAELDFRKRRRSSAVTSRWQGRHSVRKLSRSHCPPPSATGIMWSASHSDRRDRIVCNPYSRNPALCAGPRARFSAAKIRTVSAAHKTHIPRSRAKTWSRKYPGSDRNRH